ncbi:TerB family tellurite resistance protein [Aestuariirhabdus sp. Z084]|uniref:tellurite resistance TerB family protein n=1 Tax=Aestuariirhabdus haliotis TaxID=2918751 RepID=UPI00201B40C0|nr:TerB family tellurite resistance protein [Aestuariirhabdus haliotis]MCL6414638.1 TerB family tellurite resistance protein [Aestuariirhabdus haliotis]MCL6418380.1 TerB family tellurite resistance protein [Aestuariirhabdus haliotis]
MFQSLKQFFDELNGVPEAPQHQHSIELACAVLLIEISKADATISDEELVNIRKLINNSLDVQSEEMDNLLSLAQTESADATSLHPFVELVNTQLEYPDKVALVRSMWQVAYTDDQLDKYEEYQIRKLSELLYVAHGDFIRTKLEVLALREGQ